jgi:hypothetical protein
MMKSGMMNTEAQHLSDLMREPVDMPQLSRFIFAPNLPIPTTVGINTYVAALPFLQSVSEIPDVKHGQLFQRLQTPCPALPPAAITHVGGRGCAAAA